MTSVIRQWVATIFCAALVVGCVSGLAVTGRGEKGTTDAKRGAVKESAYRKGEFQLHDLAFVPPKDIKILKSGGEGAELVLQSQDGYFITFNSSASAPNDSLDELAKGLENVYLKEGGKWLRKLAYRQFPLAGTEALDVLYQGPHTKDRVIYWRTPKRDFAIMFFAPTLQFDQLTLQFDVMLDSFDTRLVKSDEPEAANPEHAFEKPEAPQIGNERDQNRDNHAPMRTIENIRLGFSVNLPKSWIRDSSGTSNVRWGGAKGSEDALMTFDLQNVKMAGLGRANQKQAAEFLAKRFFDQISTFASDVDFAASHLIEPAIDRKIIWYAGRFSYAGRWYKQNLAISGRKNDDVFHIFAVTAPEAVFDKTNLSKIVISSFKPIE